MLKTNVKSQYNNLESKRLIWTNNQPDADMNLLFASIFRANASAKPNGNVSQPSSKNVIYVGKWSLTMLVHSLGCRRNHICQHRVRHMESYSCYHNLKHVASDNYISPRLMPRSASLVISANQINGRRKTMPSATNYILSRVRAHSKIL